MRRALLTLLCALVAVPTALAASKATGDGVLELQDVNGNVRIGSIAQPAKGTLWGQIDLGTITTYDPVPEDGLILVSGYDTKTPGQADPNNPSAKTMVYKGSNMHFRVTGGKYKLIFAGTNINLVAVGVGTATFNGDKKQGDPGTYSVDTINAGNWQPVPLLGDTTVPHTVQFGVPSP
jgi:hypothetical protein